MEGVASVEDIDNVAKIGFNHPMGPLFLADLIGNDTVLSIMQVLYDGFGDPKYRPYPLPGILGGNQARDFTTTIKNKMKYFASRYFTRTISVLWQFDFPNIL